MAFIKWTDELSVHVSEIDSQHQNLISLINMLHDAMLARKGKEVLSETLDQLASYTVYHFTTEENYMKQFNYIGLPPHKREHDTFVAKVQDFIRDYEANRLGLSLEILNFLRDWVKNHIMGTDRKYSETFHKNGLM